jgi:hypothetical protein
MVGCAGFRSRTTFPLPPSVESGGFETRSPGGRGKGEGGRSREIPNAIPHAERYGNNTSLPEWRMLFKIFIKALRQGVFLGGVQGLSHLLKEFSDVKGFADKSSGAKIKCLA